MAQRPAPMPSRAAGLQSLVPSVAAAPPPFHKSHVMEPGRIDPSGLACALVVLLSACLSRRQTEASQLDYFYLQDQLEADWNKDCALAKARADYARQEAERRQQEAYQRIAESTQKAKQTSREQAARERKREEAAQRESARLQALKDAERRAFEEKDAVLKAELAKRVEVERRLIEEAEAAARAEAERHRREAEAARAAALAEQRRREEEERQRQAEAARRRQEERRELRELQRNFAVRVEGSAAVLRPPKGALTEGRVPKEATVKVEVSAQTPLTEPQSQACLYTSVRAAEEDAVRLAATAAAAACESYASAVRLQALAGQGPLEVMDEVELQHWMRVAACRAAAEAVVATQAILRGFGEKPNEQRKPFQMRTERGVLPEDHPRRERTVLAQAIGHVEAEREEAAAGVLRELMREEDEAFYQGLKAPAPAHMGAALLLAHFLDRMWHDRPSRRVEASPWYEQAAALVKRELRSLTAGEPKDSLLPTSEYISATLGAEHPVAASMAELAEANLSPAAKAARAEKQRLLEAELAAALLEEDWPDRNEIAAAKMAEQEARMPIPERVWALRNVAGTLAMGGEGEKARARKLLEQAVRLKQEFAGGPDHPGVLPELDALAAVLESEPEWREDAVAVRSRMLKTLADVAQRYLQTGDPASAVILLEAAVREFEDTLGFRHPGITALSKRAEKLFDSLAPEQRQQVAGKRRQAGIAKAVANAFTEDLAIYKSSGLSERTKAELWDEGGVAPLMSLV
ncbi:hypothetical protein WJX72_011277 [[Myrmecia] bisecta]|uniref:Uncharacterized protein n=1 Tax=[Myrmecia] bisecta TaxID=41462 RepID=A0AAW1Q6D7_9CHLO